MPLIPLQDLHPNPFRDFDLHPIDQPQVERLKASINADGFWASVVARPAADSNGYQMAFGHHRMEAARQLGLEVAPIEVRDLDDRQMVRMLAAENATQRGTTAAAALDSIQAICKILAYDLLRYDEAGFGKIHQNHDIRYAECRGRLEAGDGIGRGCVQGFAVRDTFSETQIRVHLGVLKDSGRMAGIIAEAQQRVEAELRAEREAADRALAEAEAREAEARTQAEKEAAAKQTRRAQQAVRQQHKAAVGARKAKDAVERQPIIYDPRCTALFKLESHAEVFRQIVTSETFQAYLALDQQFGFAQNMLARIRENNPGRKDITATDIRDHCWSMIEGGVGRFKKHLRFAPERPWKEELIDALNYLRRGAKDARKGCAMFEAAARKGETLTAKQREQLERHLAAFRAAVAIGEQLPKNNLKLVEG